MRSRCMLRPTWQAARFMARPGAIVGARAGSPVIPGNAPGHGKEDPVGSVAMTQRLQDRRRENGRTPEVHYRAGQDHTPDGVGENEHQCRMIDSLRRSPADVPG